MDASSCRDEKARSSWFLETFNTIQYICDTVVMVMLFFVVHVIIIDTGVIIDYT